MPLDVLVTGGRVATLAGPSGFGWVEALGITDGRVAFAGSAVDLETRADPHTLRIELDPDEVAIPGLTDAHLHLAEGGLSLDRVDLSATPTLEDGLAAVRAAHEALPRDAWLEGHGWHNDRWGVWPTADDLERVAPGRAVALWAHDHHALWVSRRAMAIAGIGADTADPSGGIIRRGADGSPTGVLHESAARLVMNVVPAASQETLEASIVRLARDLIRLGVVAVHDPGALSLQEGLGAGIAAYRALDERGDLPIRVHAAIRSEQLEAATAAGLQSGDPLGPPGGRARFGWLKLFADGTLASRTAALLEPIEPEEGRALPPGTERGIWMTEPEEVAELARRAADVGITTMIHAIGDRSCRASLDALEPTAGRTRLMPRLEHVQLLHPDDRPRFAAAGIAASIQPIHVRADAPIALRLWGDRAETRGYPMRSLVDAGAVVAFGTDAPVEPIDPWPGLSMAVTRIDGSWPEGIPPFGRQERLTLEAALRAQCVAPPTVAAEDADRGRLTVGQRADLIVIPQEAVTNPIEPGGALATARPRVVIIDGDVAFER
ncbi:MAG TPA: amidohydrolase [Candidatus Limnocylindrales bacterium]|nr:amidohydrolase [Candidatus Limnocylindrales bacterium]